jgi:SAM-dependent methyltransferase
MTPTPSGARARFGLSDPVAYSVRRRHLDRDLDTVSATIRGQVLEIGCGRSGRRGRFRPPTDGIETWVLLDRDPRRRPHVCADALALPFPPSAFDTVVCLEVLEYAWEPAKVVSEMGRVLRPGGSLVLSTPFLHRADTPGDYWRFTEPALQRLVHEAGFNVTRCEAQGHALGVAASILRYAVSVQPNVTRRLLSVLLRPFFGALLWGDQILSRRHPELATFSTGYLVTASKRPAEKP